MKKYSRYPGITKVRNQYGRWYWVARYFDGRNVVYLGCASSERKAFIKRKEELQKLKGGLI